jgi:hypothetical protein
MEMWKSCVLTNNEEDLRRSWEARRMDFRVVEVSEEMEEVVDMLFK